MNEAVLLVERKDLYPHSLYPSQHHEDTDLLISGRKNKLHGICSPEGRIDIMRSIHG